MFKVGETAVRLVMLRGEQQTSRVMIKTVGRRWITTSSRERFAMRDGDGDAHDAAKGLPCDYGSGRATRLFLNEEAVADFLEARAHILHLERFRQWSSLPLDVLRQIAALTTQIA